MKVVGRILLNGQGQDQGSSGLNNIHIKAEAEVREQSDALDIVESVLLPSSFFLHIAISHII